MSKLALPDKQLLIIDMRFFNFKLAPPPFPHKKEEKQGKIHDSSTSLSPFGKEILAVFQSILI